MGSDGCIKSPIKRPGRNQLYQAIPRDPHSRSCADLHRAVLQILRKRVVYDGIYAYSATYAIVVSHPDRTMREIVYDGYTSLFQHSHFFKSQIFRSGLSQPPNPLGLFQIRWTMDLDALRL